MLHLYLKVLLGVSSSKWFCGARVVLQVFGLGSGFVATVMAVERWLALSHSFYHQKNVQLKTIYKTIFFGWLFNAALVCAPLLGFGRWYDDDAGKCVRYRDA